MKIEPGALDANILVYAVEASAPQHAVSRALIEAACNPTTAPYLTSQVLCEFYSTAANPCSTGIPACVRLTQAGGLPTSNPPERRSRSTMLQRIYTFNTRDFAVFPELTVATPPETA